jgi:hypothetical protein
MIDCSARQKLKNLLIRFLNKDLTSTAFFEHPERYDILSSEDPSIKAIDEMLWRTYSEEVPHKLNNLELEEVDIYRRSILFLDSECTYEWPDHKNAFRTVSSLGPLIRVLTLGLSWFIDIELEKNARQFWDSFEKSGDLKYWPFIGEQQYSTAIGSTKTKA